MTWRILQPTAETLYNLFPDPSLEYDPTAPLLASSAVAVAGYKTTSDAYTGAQAVVLGSASSLGDTAYQLTTGDPLVSGTTYTLVLHYKLLVLCDITVIVQAGVSEQINQTITGTVGDWQRVEFVFTAITSAAPSLSVQFYPHTAPSGYTVFGYLDAIMLLIGNHPDVTYFDGTTDGCYWRGVPGRSTSVCPANNPAVGTWQDLAARVQSTADVGLPKLTNVTSDSGQWERTVPELRDSAFNLWIDGESVPGLRAKRAALLQQLRLGTEVTLQFSDDANDAIPLCTAAVVQAGMTFDKLNGFVEQPTLTLRSHDPYWYACERSGGLILPLGKPQTFNYIAALLPDGTWSARGTLNGRVNVVKVGRYSGRLYIGGAFTQDTSTGTTLNRLAYWNETTGRWAALGSGCPTDVYDLGESPLQLSVLAAGGFNALSRSSNTYAGSWTGAQSHRALILLHDANGDDYWLPPKGNWSALSGYAYIGSDLLAVTSGTLRASATVVDGSGVDQVFIGGTAMIIGGQNTEFSQYRGNTVTYTGVQLVKHVLQNVSNFSVYALLAESATSVLIGASDIGTGSGYSKLMYYNGAGFDQFPEYGIAAPGSVFSAYIGALAKAPDGTIYGGGFATAMGQSYLTPTYFDGSATQSGKDFVITGTTLRPLDIVHPGSTTAMAVANDGTLYVAFDTTGSTLVGEPRDYTVTALGEQQVRLEAYGAGGMPAVVQNLTTGAVMHLRNPKSGDVPFVLDTARVGSPLYRMTATQLPIIGGVAPGSVIDDFVLQPGVNRLKAFGSVPSVLSNGYGPHVALVHAIRHLSLDGAYL